MVLAVAWAVYLIPKALKHHDEVARTRSIDRFSTAMRVLARREPVNRRDARLVVTPARAAGNPRVLAPTRAAPDEAPVPVAVTVEARGPAARIEARRTAARAAARRRRRILDVPAAVHRRHGRPGRRSRCVPWWSVAIPGGLTLAYLRALPHPGPPRVARTTSTCSTARRVAGRDRGPASRDPRRGAGRSPRAGRADAADAARRRRARRRGVRRHRGHRRHRRSRCSRRSSSRPRTAARCGTRCRSPCRRTSPSRRPGARCAPSTSASPAPGRPVAPPRTPRSSPRPPPSRPRPSASAGEARPAARRRLLTGFGSPLDRVVSFRLAPVRPALSGLWRSW